MYYADKDMVRREEEWKRKILAAGCTCVEKKKKKVF